jgi:hypothetical protein
MDQPPAPRLSYAGPTIWPKPNKCAIRGNKRGWACQMKENSSFSFRIAHHHLVLRPQTNFPGGLGIPGDERYG